MQARSIPNTSPDCGKWIQAAEKFPKCIRAWQCAKELRPSDLWSGGVCPNTYWKQRQDGGFLPKHHVIRQVPLQRDGKRKPDCANGTLLPSSTVPQSRGMGEGECSSYYWKWEEASAQHPLSYTSQSCKSSPWMRQEGSDQARLWICLQDYPFARTADCIRGGGDEGSRPQDGSVFNRRGGGKI